MERLGVGWPQLSARHPRLVYCAISGYGQNGPRAAAAGHDVNYIAYAGLLGINGPADRPVIPGVQIGDLAGGGMAAVISILAALHARATTGRGDFCDVSMMDGAMSWLTIHAGAFAATREPPRREEMHLSGRYPCYRLYPAADGWLAVGALEPQFWSALCTALGREDFVDDAFATGERRAEVITELEVLFASRTRAEWMKEFEGEDVCVAPVNDFAEAFSDPQLVHRDMVFESEVPGAGPWTHVGNPLRVGGVGGRADGRPPPKLGEHTSEVLGEHGLVPDALTDLRSAGAI